MKKLLLITFLALGMTAAMTGCNANNGKVDNNATTAAENITTIATTTEHTTEPATTEPATTEHTTNIVEDIQSNVSGAISNVESAVSSAVNP